jgi:HPt (histidine-containing phosphotransfer) domain-containing protein
MINDALYRKKNSHSMDDCLEKSAQTRTPLRGPEQCPINPEPHPPSTDLQPLIDSGMVEIIPQLITLFLERAPRTIETAETALRASHASELTRAAHDLKGSCSNLGANRLRQLCQQLEDLGQSESLQTAPEVFRSVEAEFARVRSELLLTLELHQLTRT